MWGSIPAKGLKIVFSSFILSLSFKYVSHLEGLKFLKKQLGDTN